MPRFVDLVVELASPDRPVVLIDGGSGAGKTSFAQALVAAWPGTATLVSLDALYPGWDGLAAASAAVARDVLRAEGPGYQRWNWTTGRPDAWIDLDPTLALIVEGCGALTPANRALATAGIWLVEDPRVRRERAIARDGPVLAEQWERWEAQERTHWRRHRPRELADWWILDGGDRIARRPPGAGRMVGGHAGPTPP